MVVMDPADQAIAFLCDWSPNPSSVEASVIL